MYFGNKDRPKMSENEKKAKLKALKEAHGMASDAMKEGLSGAKKSVTVSADSKKGLQKGLDLAEDLVGEKDEDDQELGEREEDSQDELESAQDESEPMDEDEIDAQIEHLMKLKEKLLNS